MIPNDIDVSSVRINLNNEMIARYRCKHVQKGEECSCSYCKDRCKCYVCKTVNKTEIMIIPKTLSAIEKMANGMCRSELIDTMLKYMLFKMSNQEGDTK